MKNQLKNVQYVFLSMTSTTEYLRMYDVRSSWSALLKIDGIFFKVKNEYSYSNRDWIGKRSRFE